MSQVANTPLAVTPLLYLESHSLSSWKGTDYG